MTAATLDSDENVAGRFALKTAVGELGVPLSPDSLVLPKEARRCRKSLRDAAIGLLGKAWAVATAPPAGAAAEACSASRRRSCSIARSKSAEAGFRVSLHEPLADSAAQLAMDFIGSKYARLPSARQAGRSRLRAGRTSAASTSCAASRCAATCSPRPSPTCLRQTLTTPGAAAFHAWLAERWSYRPGARLGARGRRRRRRVSPYELTVIDAPGRRARRHGSTARSSRRFRSPISSRSTTGGGRAAELAVLAAPEPGALTVRLDAAAPASRPERPCVLSVVLPDGCRRPAPGRLSMGANERPSPLAAGGGPNSRRVRGAWRRRACRRRRRTSPVADPPPTVIGVDPAARGRSAALRAGEARVPGRPHRRRALQRRSDAAERAGPLLSHDITNYLPAGNRVVGVALQPGRRIAFLALRDPIGPFVPRTIDDLQRRRPARPRHAVVARARWRRRSTTTAPWWRARMLDARARRCRSRTCACSICSTAASSRSGSASRQAGGRQRPLLVGLRRQAAAQPDPRRRYGDRRVPRRAVQRAAQGTAAERRRRVPRPRHHPRHRPLRSRACRCSTRSSASPA